MSTCPSNDIHSIYLDNELPDSYVAEYEAHVKTCESCAQKITAFRAIRNALKTEAIAITPDSHYLEQSWERLQARKSYSRVTKHIAVFPAHWGKYIVAAAAAVVISVTIPVKLLYTPNTMQAQASLTPIARNDTVVLSKDNVVINGNLNQPDIFAPPFSPHDNSYALTRYSGTFPVNVSENNAVEKSHGDFDVFRPNFDNGHAITIKINIPVIVAPPLLANVNMSTTQFASATK